MDRYQENVANTDLYARIKLTPMSAREREVVLNALHTAEVFANDMLWVMDRGKWLIARVFEKLAGLKHSH